MRCDDSIATSPAKSLCGPSCSIPDTNQVRWGSTGWTNDRNVTQMMELLSARGEVAIAGRVGRQRLWDLLERATPVFP